MKLLSACVLALCLGIASSGANLSINFTSGSPVYTVDTANWDSFTASNVNPFSGTFIANTPSTGTNTVYILNPHTGDELWTLDFSYSASGDLETFGVNSIKDNDTTAPPGGSLTSNATGASVDITALLSPHGLPSNITIQQTTPVPAAVPEPAASTLVAAGVIGLFLVRRYRTGKAR